jgi:DNA-binding Lrp family transcriptional regulator
MASAFVLVNSRQGSSKVVLDELRHVAGVTQIHEITGAYDIIVMMEADSVELVKSTAAKIRRIEGVSTTLTLVKVE